MQDKYTQLNKAKRLALACLIFAASVFIGTILIPKFYSSLEGAWWLGLIKMASEAALIGGLADWCGPRFADLISRYYLWYFRIA